LASGQREGEIEVADGQVDVLLGMTVAGQPGEESPGPGRVAADKEVIAYCRIGERSAHTWFVLHELLGFPSVRNYDGSWTEYGSLVGVPVER
jgi:rhodanese-related sulfurtransferase